MKIVTLMENTATEENMASEHGLSLYIETDSCRILFDAGQSGSFADNAEKLGVDLKTVDLAVLSHGHYDHGGGLQRFLQINDTAPVYVQKDAFGDHYNAAGRYIGLDRQLLDSPRLCFVEKETQIAEGIRLCTMDALPEDTSGLQRMENGRLCPEDFRHEQYLLIQETGKTVCFSGCSHRGIRQIAAHFQPDVLVGGFHFMKTEDEPVLRSAAQALLWGETVYYTGHCTGQKQYACLKTVMGQRLHYLAAGSVLEL